MRSEHIFFIGPASVGKTTVGGLIAGRIGYDFIDIDKEFCDRVALIPGYIKEFGYGDYCEANSTLVDKLIREHPGKTVFATPSGYLVHEDSPHLVEKHLEIIANGISVLLLPDVVPLKGVDAVVARQLARWNDTRAEKERKRFLERFEKYKRYGDIKIYSLERPEMVVDRILPLLKDLGVVKVN